MVCAPSHHESFYINEESSFPAEVDSFKVLKYWKTNSNEKINISIHQFGIGCTNSLLDDKIGGKVIIGAFRLKNPPIELRGIESFLQTNLCQLVISEKNEADFKKAMEVLDSKYVELNSTGIKYKVIGLITLIVLSFIIIVILKK